MQDAQSGTRRLFSAFTRAVTSRMAAASKFTFVSVVKSASMMRLHVPSFTPGLPSASAGKADERAGQLVLQICRLGALSAHTRAAGAARGSAPPARTENKTSCCPPKKSSSFCGLIDHRMTQIVSSILPSVEIVTTCQGMNLPLFCSAVFAACSSPPQHGTSIRTTVTLLMSFLR